MALEITITEHGVFSDEASEAMMAGFKPGFLDFLIAHNVSEPEFCHLYKNDLRIT